MLAAVHQPKCNQVSASDIETYRRTGFLHLPGLIPTELISAAGAAADALPQRYPELVVRENVRIEFANEKVWKWDPVVDICPEIAAIARHPRILNVVRAIYDGREPSLFKDKLILKPPGSHGNGLHQDYTWWQGFPRTLLTVTVAIDGGTIENGCTEIYPGMHIQGLLHEPGIIMHLPDATVAGKPSQLFASNPGDVAIFNCFTPHRAGENRSSRARRQLFLTYNDGADGDLHAAHYHHMLTYRVRDLPESERANYFIR